jgi:hypothetical protein
MGEAINYALGQRDALTLFLTDPHRRSIGAWRLSAPGNGRLFPIG